MKRFVCFLQKKNEFLRVARSVNGAIKMFSTDKSTYNS